MMASGPASDQPQRDSRGYGQFCVDLAKQLTKHNVIELALIFEFPRAEIDGLKAEDIPAPNFVDLLKEKGKLQEDNITLLTDALEANNLQGIADDIRRSFDKNVKSSQVDCGEVNVRTDNELPSDEGPRQQHHIANTVAPDYRPHMIDNHHKNPPPIHTSGPALVGVQPFFIPTHQTVMYQAQPPPAWIPPPGAAHIATHGGNYAPEDQKIVRTESQQSPPDHMVLSIFVLLCCCLVCGIVAVFHSKQIRQKWEDGDEAGARAASKKAKQWSMIGLIVSSLVWAGILIPIIIIMTTGDVEPDPDY